MPDVDYEAYSGVWYQIGSTALIKAITEVDVACTTGRYSVIPDGANKGDIRVHVESYNISSGVASAFAALATFNGKKLALQFPGAPAATDYRIIYLGGSAKHKYKTAVTYSCAPGQIQGLSILSRKPTLDKKETVEGLVKIAASKGIKLEANNQFVHTVQDAITCGRNFARR